MQKYFVIGLPRTATTSVCVAALSLGFKTAHTIYTQKGLAEAELLADTPIYCDYQKLDQQFEGAKFIYLTRDLTLWLPSIKQLLKRMIVNINRDDGGFHPSLKRSIKTVFAPFNEQNIEDDAFLKDAYERHFEAAKAYFNGREQDLLILDVTDENAFERFSTFLGCKQSGRFDVINQGGKVTAWNGIKSPLKIPSTRNGKVDLH